MELFILARSFLLPNIENKAWLPYNSQIFNYVEIDSRFYNIPSKQMVTNWNRKTPDNFRFTAKFPKIITHDKKFKNVQKDLELFYQRMEPLKIKLFQTGNIIRTWLN